MPSRTSARPSRHPIDKSSSTTSQRRPSPIKKAPPELADDAIGEILLRLPPDQPACLVRASLICKRWRSLACDGAFLREYRAFHRRTPPVLGFFHDDDEFGRKSTIYFPIATMPATQPVPQPPPAMSARSSYRSTLDCRHGRVLFETQAYGGAPPSSTLTVWDPLTGDHKCFSAPLDVKPSSFVGAVLCAAAYTHDACCDRLECSGGPFLVVIAGVTSHNGDDHNFANDQDLFVWGRVYSSETGVWGAPPATIDISDFTFLDHIPCSPLVGGAIHFFIFGLSVSILKYDLVGGVLSVMEAPPQAQNGDEPGMIVFAAARDGELGAATLEGYSLHLWSWRASAAEGGGEWARVKVIELDVMIQFSIGDPTTEFQLAGFAQDAALIFVCVNYDDMFTVDLKSGHISKTCKRGRYYGYIFPLVTFCTPDRTSAGLQLVPMMIDG